MWGLMGGLSPLGALPAVSAMSQHRTVARQDLSGAAAATETFAPLSKQQSGALGSGGSEVWGRGQGTAQTRHHILFPSGPFIEHGATPSPTWGPGVAGCDAPPAAGGGPGIVAGRRVLSGGQGLQVELEHLRDT